MFLLRYPKQAFHVFEIIPQHLSACCSILFIFLYGTIICFLLAKAENAGFFYVRCRLRDGKKEPCKLEK